MTHAELVQRAVRWLRTAKRCKIVFAEMSYAGLEYPDAIGWGTAGFSHLVECKASRSDFRADKKKPHRRSEAFGGTPLGRYRYYLAPPDVIPPDEVPDDWGLLVAHPRRIEVVRQVTYAAPCPSPAEAMILVSAIRRYQLGVAFDETTARWAPYPRPLMWNQRIPDHWMAL